MARYLVSLNTGVVLPYNEAALKSPGVRETTSEESAAYEAAVATRSVKPIDVVPPPAEPLIDTPKPEPVVKEVEVVTQDFAEGEPDIDAVLGALEAD